MKNKYYKVDVNGISVQTVEGDYHDSEHPELEEYVDTVLMPMLEAGKHGQYISSYWLKHRIENIIGKYVSNYQLKAALARRGIAGKYEGPNSINPLYKIKKSDKKRLEADEQAKKAQV